MQATVSNAASYSGYARQGPVPIPVSFMLRGNVTYKQDYVVYSSAEYRRGGLRLAGEYYWGKSVIEGGSTGSPDTMRSGTREGSHSPGSRRATSNPAPGAPG